MKIEDEPRLLLESAAAAWVPIATMLMVMEMAGGFHLLLPAGMAVMISYLLQSVLSSKVKYRSHYEG